MLGANFNDVGWPACGEIDIMEHWGHNPTHVSSATHTTACSSLNCDQMTVGSTTINDYATAFHVYSLEWSENELRFLIDDNYLYSYNPNPKTSDNWPFDKPHFFILNVAMGAHWFTIDPNFIKSTMEIDYVRVYQ
jgi:beta-glucanase (GH16 family)